MARTGHWYRWVLLLGAAGMVGQAGACSLNNPQFVNQFVLPQFASVFADSVFFLLDNALVRLTT